MSAELLKRATALRAHYKGLEAVPGSGYHDNDRNPARNDLFLAPQRAGHRVGDEKPAGGWPPKMSEHVVAFFDHDEDECVHFVGPDAQKVADALQRWLKVNAKGDPSNKPGTERKLILRILPKLKVEQADGQPRLSIWLCDWNDVLVALHAEGIGVAGLPLEE